MAAPAADDEHLTAVRKQVEYYFSDSNLPKDRFLRAKTEETTEGYVPISVLLTFNRLKALNATEQSIATALKTSELLVVHPDAFSIRRVSPLPPKSLFPIRAVFAKGWLPGGPEPSIEDINSLFAPSGSVLSVNIRRWLGDDGEKHFKGSIFVEMDSSEAAERVLAEEYSITVQKDGKSIEKTLLIELFADYIVRKRKDDEKFKGRRHYKGRRDGKDKPRPSKSDSKTEAEAKPDDKAEAKPETKDEDVKPESKSQPKPESKAEPITEPDATNGAAGKTNDGSTARPGTDDMKTDTPNAKSFTKGVILRFEDVGEDVSREDLREAVEEFGEVTYVDFSRGEKNGYLRFSTPEGAAAASTGLVKSGKMVGGHVPVVWVLKGDAEEVYWQSLRVKQDARKKRNRDDRGHQGGRPWKRGRRPNRGRGRGGYRGEGRR